MQALCDCHTLPRGGSQESGLSAGLQVLSDRTPTWPTPQGRGLHWDSGTEQGAERVSWVDQAALQRHGHGWARGHSAWEWPTTTLSDPSRSVLVKYLPGAKRAHSSGEADAGHHLQTTRSS